MKLVLLTGALCGIAWMGLRAQSLPEMIEQLVELKTLERSVRQDYQTMQSGLGTIVEISNNEYLLHSDYIGSLKLVKPALAADPRVQALQANLMTFITRLESEMDYWRKQPALQQ